MRQELAFPAVVHFYSWLLQGTRACDCVMSIHSQCPPCHVRDPCSELPAWESDSSAPTKCAGYASNGRHVNHYLVSFLGRIANAEDGLNLEPMLYQVRSSGRLVVDPCAARAGSAPQSSRSIAIISTLSDLHSFCWNTPAIPAERAVPKADACRHMYRMLCAGVRAAGVFVDHERRGVPEGRSGGRPGAADLRPPRPAQHVRPHGAPGAGQRRRSAQHVRGCHHSCPSQRRRLA